MILCIGTTPAVQRVMVFRRFALDEVNRAASTFDGVAGKSINVAKVLKALGEKPVEAGFLGGDRGEFIERELRSRGIEGEFARVGARTRQCVTILDEATGQTTELVEESRAVTAADYRKLLLIVRRLAGKCRVMVISGTITPGGPEDFYRRCVEIAERAGALSIVDGKGAVLVKALEARPGLVKPNRAELEATLGCELGGEQTVVDAMKQLWRRGAQRVVVTSGKKPALAFDGRRLWRVQPPQVKALNPIGSGDAFTAAVAWRLAGGDDLGEACRWGAAAGAANALGWMPGELDSKMVARLAKRTRAVMVDG